MRSGQLAHLTGMSTDAPALRALGAFAAATADRWKLPRIFSDVSAKGGTHSVGIENTFLSPS
jgi:hypothetical protein